MWTWIREYPTTRESFQGFLDEARAETAAGAEFAFATVDARDGRPIGMTRYMALRPADRGVEIGWTWLTPAAWKTGANVEAKLLQLGYAFETLGCMRVELKTHAGNERSRENPMWAEEYLVREHPGEEGTDPTAPPVAGGAL